MAGKSSRQLQGEAEENWGDTKTSAEALPWGKGV